MVNITWNMERLCDSYTLTRVLFNLTFYTHNKSRLEQNQMGFSTSLYNYQYIQYTIKYQIYRNILFDKSVFEKHRNNLKFKGSFKQQFGNHKDFTFYKYDDGKKEIKFLR